jgi:hypothetical protein
VANGRIEIKLSDFLLGLLLIALVVQTLLQIESSSEIASRLADLSVRVERLLKVYGGEQ